ncbi:MAG: hypothetical protein IJ783_03005 [Kiritimatiellae bacterium]|nr:hypothetical protein [Kiritimatiellia bacterium]
MIFRFFLFKSAGLENGSLSPSVRTCFAKPGVSWSQFHWPGEAALKLCKPFDVESCRAAIAADPVLARIPLRHIETAFYSGPHPQGTDAGLVVKCHVRDRDNLFAALLGFARKNGLSIADHCFGLLLLSAERESIQGLTWLRLRRNQVTEWIGQMYSGMFLYSLCRHGPEDFYVVCAGKRFEKPESVEAATFREALGQAMYPDERLETHRGRVVIAGPGESYRLHFNWEGSGKHAEWTADFREPSCPIVPLSRIPTRLLRRRGWGGGIVPVGMFDPRVVALLPDPADRYASLALANRKLKERIPRALFEELRCKAAENALNNG